MWRPLQLLMYGCRSRYSRLTGVVQKAFYEFHSWKFLKQAWILYCNVKPIFENKIFLIFIVGEDILTFSPTALPHLRVSTTVVSINILESPSEVEFYQTIFSC